MRAEFAPSTIDIPASPSTRASTQPSSPELISLRFRWPLAEVLCTREPTLVAIADQRMTEGLPSVGRPAEGTHALMLPVYYEGASEETVLILGLSPFVHYDDIGKKFFLFLTTQIAAGLAAVAVSPSSIPCAVLLIDSPRPLSRTLARPPSSSPCLAHSPPSSATFRTSSGRR